MDKEKKEKVFINGYEYFLDRVRLLLYDKEYGVDGIPIRSNHLTENEKKQVFDYIRYGK